MSPHWSIYSDFQCNSFFGHYSGYLMITSIIISSKVNTSSQLIHSTVTMLNFTYGKFGKYYLLLKINLRYLSFPALGNLEYETYHEGKAKWFWDSSHNRCSVNYYISQVTLRIQSIALQILLYLLVDSKSIRKHGNIFRLTRSTPRKYNKIKDGLNIN